MEAVTPVGRIETDQQGRVLAPLSLISAQEVVLHPDHLHNIVDSYQSGSNEEAAAAAPLQLARVPGRDQLLVVDGYYRLAALWHQKADHAVATVADLSMEEVLDKRMFSASSHRFAEVARLLDISQEAWQQTPWASKLTHYQALGLAKNVSKGTRLPISGQEAADIKAWVNQKSGLWGVKPASLLKMNVVANTAAPELLQMTRINRHGRSEYCFSLVHLEVITKGFPGRYLAQHLLADAAQEYRLGTAQLTSLVKQHAEDQTIPLKHLIDTILRQRQEATATQIGQSALEVVEELEVSEEPEEFEEQVVVEAPQPDEEAAPSKELISGNTVYRVGDWEQRREKLMRIINRGKLNRRTEALARDYKYSLNRLDVEADGRSLFNGTISISKGVDMEVVNALLADYLYKPTTLANFCQKYQLISDPERVHESLKHLKVNDLVFYNPALGTLVGLKPLIIKDKRRR
jgi:hypothetical protein